MLKCHHNTHPCLDTRGGGSCEYFKAGSKSVGLMAGDYIHMTFIIPQISLLSRHFLQTRYRQKYVAYLYLYFIQLFVRTCSYHHFSCQQNNSAIIPQSLGSASIQTKDHAQEIKHKNIFLVHNEIKSKSTKGCLV